MRVIVAVAALLGLALVAAGAAGAHVIAAEAGSQAARWDSALMFGFVHVLGAIVAACLPLGRLKLAAAGAFLAGVVLFSGIEVGKIMIAGMSGSSSTPLDALTFLVPVGGTAFMAGWLLLALAALLHKPSVVIGN